MNTRTITSFIAVIALIVTFTSCEKEYKCTCQNVDSTGMVTSMYTKSGTFTASDAQTWCKSDEGKTLSIVTKCTLR